MSAAILARHEEFPESHAYRNPEGLSIIAQPLADEKLTKKALKVVKKAAKHKGIRRGVKEVVKGLRKDVQGVVIIAGNITPIDVVSHIPILCEEKEIPYVYVPQKEALGAAALTKRPTSCIMIVKPKKDSDYADKYDSLKDSVKKVAPKWASFE